MFVWNAGGVHGVLCTNTVIFYIFEYRAEYGASILFNSGFM